MRFRTFLAQQTRPYIPLLRFRYTSQLGGSVREELKQGGIGWELELLLDRTSNSNHMKILHMSR